MKMRMKDFAGTLWVTCAVTVLLAGFHLEAVFAGSSMEHYTSEVDGSEQPYGLYIPEPFDPDAPHPVVFYAHSRGEPVRADFPDYIEYAGKLLNYHRRSYADEKGWILVNLGGRGQTRYQGIGENDFFRVLDELRARYEIDENRIYLTGASMGGSGAFRLGFRHPDVFAAVSGTDGAWNYRWYHRAWYASVSDLSRIEPSREPLLQSGSAVDITENGMHLGMHMIVDTGDARAEENGRALHARLSQLGYPHSYNEKPGIHVEGYDCLEIYDFFSQHVKESNPKHVVLKANELKYGSAYWVRIDRLEKSLAADIFATIEARINEEIGTVELAPTNLLRYSLFLTRKLVGSDEVSVFTNGEFSYAGPVGEITIFASLDESGNIVGWSTTDTLPRGLRKTAQIEGPIGHAYTSRFVLVRGTIGTEDETSENRAEAEKFAGEWNSFMHANISPVTDTSITEDDIPSSNLILFGTADSNSLIEEINDFLPIRIWRNSIAAGANVYEGDNYGLYMIFPNPLNPDRYVVISHGTITGSNETDLEALPWYWPDYVVFDMDVIPSPAVPGLGGAHVYLPDAWVKDGFFDQYWQLDRDQDGMDDIWEKPIVDAYRLKGIDRLSPEDDNDSDGQDNRTEYNAGTDGTDPASLFGVLSVKRDPTDRKNFLVSWKVVPGRSYSIEWADTLAGPWNEIAELDPDDVADDGDVRTWTDKGTDPSMQNEKPGDCHARFYRVSAYRSGRIVQ